MKRTTSETSDELTEQERETVKTLVNYPKLEQTFAESNGAEKIKRKMRDKITEVERVIRRGTQSEADKAAKILAAYQTTLDFLEELERLRLQKTK